jgi:hypothetical protein
MQTNMCSFRDYPFIKGVLSRMKPSESPDSRMSRLEGAAKIRRSCILGLLLPLHRARAVAAPL